MKLLSNRQAKKRGGLAAARAGSVVRSRLSTAIHGAADNILVRDPDQARYADPTLKKNLPYHYSIYGIPTRCQVRKRKQARKLVLCEKFPR